jgi:hypothetical protein
MFVAMFWPGWIRFEERVHIAAWLSAPSANDVLPFLSIFMRYRPRRIPTSSASWMVCSLSGPRW